MAYDLEAIRKKYSSNSSNAATPVSSGQGPSNNVNYSYNAGGVSVGNSSLEDLRRRYSYEPKTVTARTITSNDQARLRQQALQAGTVNEEEEKKKNKKIFGEGGVLSDAWNWIKGGVKSGFAGQVGFVGSAMDKLDDAGFYDSNLFKNRANPADQYKRQADYYQSLYEKTGNEQYKKLALANSSLYEKIGEGYQQFTPQESARTLRDLSYDIDTKAQEDIEKGMAGRGTAGQLIGQGVISGTGMLMDYVSGGGLANMFIRSYGNSYNEAKRQGISEDKLDTYALTHAAVEVISEKIFEGPWAKIYGKGGLANSIKGLNRVLGGNSSIASTLLKNFAEEGAEEVAAQLMDYAIDKGLGFRPDNWSEDDWTELWQSFVVGGGMGLLGGGANVIRGTALGNQYRGQAQDIINEGLTYESGTAARDLAERLNNTTPGGYQIYRQIEENQNAYDRLNDTAKIQQAARQLGLDEEQTKILQDDYEIAKQAGRRGQKTNVEKYIAGVKEAYNYAKYGASIEDAAENGAFKNDINETQRQHAYKFGEMARDAADNVTLDKSATVTVEGVTGSIEGIERKGSAVSVRIKGSDGNVETVEINNMDEAPKAVQVISDAFGEAAGAVYKAYDGKQNFNEFIQAARIVRSAALNSSVAWDAFSKTARAKSIGKTLTMAQKESIWTAVQGTQEHAAKMDSIKASNAAGTQTAGKVNIYGGKVDSRSFTVNVTRGGKTSSIKFEGYDQSKAQKGSVEAKFITVAKAVARMTGADVRLFYDESGNMGIHRRVDPETGRETIGINMANIDASGNALMVKTMSHELTHFIQANSSKDYQALKTFMFDKLLEKNEGMTLEDLIQSKIDREGISATQAEDEVVADGCEMMLRDSKVFTELARENMTLAQKIKSWLDDFITTLRSLYGDQDADYEEARYLMQWATDLQKLWDRGLKNAAINRAAAEAETEAPAENSITGVSETINNVEETTQMSYRSLAQAAGFEAVRGADGERYWAYNGKRVRNITKEDIRKSPIGAMITASIKSDSFKNGISTDDADKQMKFFADICNMAANTRDYAMAMKFAGSAAFTALKANSDKQYGTTYDFPSICTKTQAMIDAMSADMVKKGRGLKREEIVDLYRRVFASGNPVNCPECYVFSRWIGIGGLLDNIKTYQNKYCSMTPVQVRAEFNKLADEITAFAAQNGLSFGKAKGKIAENAQKKYNKLQEKIDKAENQGEPVKDSDRELLKKFKDQYTTAKAMTWIQNVYFAGDLSSNKMNPKARVPVDVLFDLNKGDSFAIDYPEAWDFRTTQGAGYGKAITPYAEAVIGEGIMTTASQKFIDQKKEYARESGGETIDNPFLHVNSDGTLTEDAMKQLESARKKMRAQNFKGGQRYSSTSDARPDTFSDFLLACLETQAMGGMVQVYTKVTGAVDAYNTWGFSSNMSLMPKFGGLDADGNIIDTAVGGMSPVTAEMLRNRNEQAGTITIGVNDEHIIAMMEDGRTKGPLGKAIRVVRDFIIPYHASGGKAETVDEMRAIQEGIDKNNKISKIHSTDYTRTQGDKVLSDVALKNVGEELWGKKLSDKDIELIHKRRAARIAILCGPGKGKVKRTLDMDVVRGSKYLSNLYEKFNGGEWTGITLAKGDVESQIYPNEFWDKSVTYENSGKVTRDYLNYCEELGFLHRFSGRIINSSANLSWATGYDKNGKSVKLTDLAYVADENGMPTKQIRPFFWKTLTDRRMYGADGRYLEQKTANLTVTPTEFMPSTSLKKGEFGKAVDESREYDKAASDKLVAEIRGEEEQFSKADFEYMKPFAEQLNDFMDKKHRSEIFGRDSLLIGPTPKVLMDIGLTKLPVVIDQKHVGYAIDGQYEGPEEYKAGHTFDIEEFAKLPEKLADPIAIIADISKKNLVVYVEMQNKAGTQTIVPLRINTGARIGGNNIDVQVAKTAFGDNDAENQIINAIIKDSKDSIRLYYANKKMIPIKIGEAVREHGVPIPNGIIHNINEPGSVVKQKINSQTETKQFKKWFGNSKIVDENGNPLVVYHGTDAEFTTFDMSKGRSTMDIQGAFFSPWEIDAAGYGQNVGAYYLSIKNPAPEGIAYKALNKFKGQNNAGIKARKYLESLGYDGVNNGNEEYIAFYPEQIKSATDNVGTFDANNPNTRFSIRNADLINEVRNINIEGAKDYHKTVGVGFSEKLARKGRAEIIGHTISSSKELAEIAQVYRDPRFETLRWFFTDEDGKVVFQTGVTASTPGTTPISDSKTASGQFEYLFDLMEAATARGATGVYLEHNHPGGDPTPSEADIETTKTIAKFINDFSKMFQGRELAFKGHAVIDTTRYATINEEGSYEFGDLSAEAVDRNIKSMTPDVPHPVLGTIINGYDKLAAAAKSVQANRNLSTVLYADSTTFEVRGIEEFNNMYGNLRRLIDNGKNRFGAERTFIATTDPEVFDKTEALIKEGRVTDAVILSGDGEARTSSHVDIHRIDPTFYNADGSYKKQIKRVGDAKFSVRDENLTEEQRKAVRDQVEKETQRIERENARLKERVEYWKSQTKRSDEINAKWSNVKRLTRELRETYDVQDDAEAATRNIINEMATEILRENYDIDKIRKDADALASDMISHAEVELGDGITVNPYAGDIEGWTEIAREDIVQALLGGSVGPEETFADRKAREIKNLKAQNKAKIQAVKETYKERMKRLRAEKNARIEQIMREDAIDKAAALAKLRAEKNAQMVQLQKDMAQHQREVKAGQKERKARTETRNKILKLQKKFQQMYEHPKQGSNQHVPTKLSGAVIDLINILNESEIRRNERMAGRTQSEYRRAQLAKAAEKLNNLAQTYSNLKGDDLYSGVYDEGIKAMLDNISKALSMGDMGQLDSATLNDIYVMMKAMHHVIVNQNRAVNEEYIKGIKETGEQLRDEILSTKNRLPKLSKYLMVQARPDTFWQMICGYKKGNAGEKIQKMFVAGEERMLKLQQQMYYIQEPLFEKYKTEMNEMTGKPLAKMYDIGLRDMDGKTLKVTRGQMLSVYMHMNCADNMEALITGGLLVPDGKSYYKDGSGFGRGVTNSYAVGRKIEVLQKEAAELREAMAENSEMSEAEIQNAEDRINECLDEIDRLRNEMIDYLAGMKKSIESQLTAFDKELMDVAAQGFQMGADAINEQTEKMYGYKKATVENYFPMHRDLTMVITSPSEAAQRDASQINLQNSGVLKERVKSRAPIQLTDILKEMDSHSEKASRIAGFMSVQRDFDHIYNVRPAGSDISVEGAVTRIWGNDRSKWLASGDQYIQNYLQSVAGANHADGFFGRIRSNTVRATLSLNLRVAMSQLASIPTAAAEVGWGNMMKGYARAAVEAFSPQAKQKLAKENVWFWQRYKGSGGMREIGEVKRINGKFDVIGKFENTGVGKALMNWCQMFDCYATYTMWDMAEEQAKSEGLKAGTDEFKARTEEVYRNIIRRTQPNYTDTERSDLLRDKSEMKKFLTMYKTQSNQNLNILVEAAGKYRAGSGSKAEVANAYTAVIIGGNVAFAGLRALANWILRGFKPKDDEDQSNTFGADVVSGVMNMLMGGSNVYDFISGLSGNYFYGVEDSALVAISDVLTKSVKYGNYLFEGKGLYPSQVNSLMKQYAKALGIPLANAEKIVEAFGVDLFSSDEKLFQSRDNRIKEMSQAELANAVKAGEVTEEEFNNKYSKDYSEYVKSSSYAKANAKIDLSQSDVKYDASNWEKAFSDNTVSANDKDNLMLTYGGEYLKKPYSNVRNLGYSPEETYRMIETMDINNNDVVTQEEVYRYISSTYSYNEAERIWDAITAARGWQSKGVPRSYAYAVGKYG